MAPIKILIINPNSSKQMTSDLHVPIENLNYNNVPPSRSHSPTPHHRIHSNPPFPLPLSFQIDNLHLSHRHRRPPLNQQSHRRQSLLGNSPPSNPPPLILPLRLPNRMLLPAPPRRGSQSAHSKTRNRDF
jgi:hypothetical protein